MTLTIDEPYAPITLIAKTVLITGGASGIGFGLAKQFINDGAHVVICGRTEASLKEAQLKLPALKYFVADVETPAGRQKLLETVKANFPEVGILVNNAGIQRRYNWKDDVETEWAERQREIDINCAAVVQLTSIFGDWFVKKAQDCAIIQVSSGLAFIPCTFAPVYGASKAFVHSFTVAVRPHFANSKVQVYEIIPPAVKSNLGGSHNFGMETDDFCQQVMAKFKKGEKECAVEMSEKGRLASRDQGMAMFEGMNKMNAHQIHPY